MANVTLVAADNQTPLGTASNPLVTSASASVATPTVVANSTPDSRWFYAGVTGGITDTSDVAVKAAGGASVINYMSALQAYNSAGVASEFVVKSGSTIIWRGYIPATTGRIEAVFSPPLQSAANTALNVALITTATATRVSAQGYAA